jgi:flavin reductase (DIM6/NTAB) family NADH-FMN oxidoreductase RutF
VSGDFPLSGRFAAPVYIVTACAGGERAGCIVGFASEVSIQPPRFMACISRVNATFPVAMRAGRLAVHLVGKEQRDLAELFGGETGDDIDKFARCSWAPAGDGTPILTACRTWFLGAVVDRVDLGDHVGCVLAPVEWRDGGHVDQLTAPDLSALEPGHPG